MKIIDWKGCYGAQWSAAPLVPEAYSHPAKVSFGLSERIYQYALERGFIQTGDHVIDPFGGIGGFAFHAMLSGLNFTGIELEQKFVDLAAQNITLWGERYRQWFPNYGTAVILQGDSRQLCRVIGDAAAVVSSPPYAQALHPENTDPQKRKARELRYQSNNPHLKRPEFKDYGSSSGQLANLPEGSYSAVITSPPFGEGETRNRSTFQDGYVADMMSRAYTQDKQGTSAGNLATLKADGDGYAAAISSPPYADQANGWNEGTGARFDPERHPGNPNKRSSANGYGVTEGNLGHMRACVSSPPFETQIAQQDRLFRMPHDSTGRINTDVGDHPANIGNDQGETFWSAAALIVAQVHQVLKPGGYAFWVTKNFVRNKKRVPFSDQWQALCEAHGFVTVERRAWVVEDHGTQGNMFGDDKLLRTERKSFFRRLAEKKGSPRIDWEDVIIMRKKADSMERTMPRCEVV